MKESSALPYHRRQRSRAKIFKIEFPSEFDEPYFHELDNVNWSSQIRPENKNYEEPASVGKLMLFYYRLKNSQSTSFRTRAVPNAALSKMVPLSAIFSFKDLIFMCP